LGKTALLGMLVGSKLGLEKEEKIAGKQGKTEKKSLALLQRSW
jgi:hypothetical protein